MQKDVPLLESFHDKNAGVSGWRIRLPGGRAVPTPAVRDGRVFVGGGFGSHEFYAFDVRTGQLGWQLHTSDDGPTAAVVSDGVVAFNTESCTLEVVDAAKGEVVWSRWLGDPLLAQPGIAAGRVFMVYPKDGRHWIGAFRLRDGISLWDLPLGHDVITAPVYAESRLYLSTCRPRGRQPRRVRHGRCRARRMAHVGRRARPQRRGVKLPGSRLMV